MTFAQKLKEMRVRAGMSQEKLAERVGVSRQAITKWETDKGAPDMDNLMALSDLFGVSVDELLGREARKAAADFLYESVTEYDIADPKRYDVKLGGARRLIVRGYEGEKLRVRLQSDTLATLEADCKVKIDDNRGRLDVDLVRMNGLTEAAAREGLTVTVELPNRYIYHVELAANVADLEIGALAAEELEFDGKVQNVTVDGFTGELEIDSNQDMKVDLRSLSGSLSLNQVAAVSRLTVPADFAFAARKRGMGNALYFEQAGQQTDDFSDPDAETVLELNGMKSELFITRR
ncbi:MAG: helix-turn-helix transcriptional regulator [Clostridia bacterium]|nr:helix-turn-helix transcriptional regulator [Clostridia bacterium]